MCGWVRVAATYRAAAEKMARSVAEHGRDGAWNLVAITQWILGIRPELDGLRVDPVLPAAWDGYRATRRFRGATYEITIRNPRRIPGRVTDLSVDGQRIDGTLVPLAPPGTTIHVGALVK